MLPNGITGFRNLKDPYIPEQEKRIFQRFCYSIATRYHCEVLSFDLDLASKNFYSAEIKTEQGRFYLLENAYYILTPTQESPVTAIQGLQTLISSIGAIPLIMDYHTHDYVTAAVSHLPHIISAGLVNLVHDSDSAEGVMKMIAAGGFKDITRISSSSPVMWQSICMTNTENILTLLTSYIESLQKVKAELQNKDAQKLYDLFDDAKNYRDSFSNEGRGPIKKTNVIFVDIPDVPGSIAQTAAILADHDLSIKNIGIMHSREFQQGALKIEFYDEQTANDAVRVLKDNGYQIFA